MGIEKDLCLSNVMKCFLKICEIRCERGAQIPLMTTAARHAVSMSCEMVSHAELKSMSSRILRFPVYNRETTGKRFINSSHKASLGATERPEYIMDKSIQAARGMLDLCEHT